MQLELLFLLSWLGAAVLEKNANFIVLSYNHWIQPSEQLNIGALVELLFKHQKYRMKSLGISGQIRANVVNLGKTLMFTKSQLARPTDV